MQLEALRLIHIEHAHIPQIGRTDPRDHVRALHDLNECLEACRELQGPLEEDHLLEVPGVQKELVTRTEPQYRGDLPEALLRVDEHFGRTSQGKHQLDVVPLQGPRGEVRDVIELDLQLVRLKLRFSRDHISVPELNKEGVVGLIFSIGVPLPKSDR